MQGSLASVRVSFDLPECQLLSESEFLKLIHRFRNGDSEAKQIIVQHNLRLVMSITQRFAGRGELEDLFQIGCVGLMKAVEKFNPTYGVKFSTYAVPVIIGEIKQHLRDEGPLKVSRSLKENALKVEQMRLELNGTFGREPTLSELVTATGLSREEIATALEAIRPVNSLQEIFSDDEGEGFSREQTVGIEEEYSCFLEQYALQEVIAKLTPRLQQLIELRFFQEKTQAEVAAIFEVSQVQICRLEKDALRRLRQLYLSEET